MSRLAALGITVSRVTLAAASPPAQVDRTGFDTILESTSPCTAGAPGVEIGRATVGRLASLGQDQDQPRP